VLGATDARAAPARPAIVDLARRAVSGDLSIHDSTVRRTAHGDVLDGA
jgi:hypothetical protein